MIDPIALRQKLRRRGIGPGYPSSLDNAAQAVREREAEVLKFRDSDVQGSQNGVHHNILDAEELAYCLNSFAQQWEVPE
jgi:hypothetical protein